MRHQFILLPLWLSILSLFIGACGDSRATAGTTADQESANIAPVFVENGCIACHSIEPGPDQQLGPSLGTIATKSSQTIVAPDYTGDADTVKAYLLESILDPEIYIVEGYESLMPKTYSASLTEQELTYLVDYLVTLE